MNLNLRIRRKYSDLLLKAGADMWRSAEPYYTRAQIAEVIGAPSIAAVTSLAHARGWGRRARKPKPVLVVDTPEPSLRYMQSEVRAWAQRNFGNNQSKVTGVELFSLAPMLGMVEELGELAHAVLKHHQGIRGFDNDGTYRDAVEDAVADLIIYAMDFSGRENLDLQTVMVKVVAKVTQRDWVAKPVDADHG